MKERSIVAKYVIPDLALKHSYGHTQTVSTNIMFPLKQTQMKLRAKFVEKFLIQKMMLQYMRKNAHKATQKREKNVDTLNEDTVKKELIASSSILSLSNVEMVHVVDTMHKEGVALFTHNLRQMKLI